MKNNEYYNGILSLNEEINALTFLEFYLSQNNTTKENWYHQIFLQNVINTKNKLKETVKLRVVVWKIQERVNHNKKMWWKKQTILIASGIVGAYFFPFPMLKVASAAQELPSFVQKSKSTFRSIFIKIDQEGRERLNFRNFLFLTGGVTITVGSIVWFVLTENESNIITRLLFKPKYFPVIPQAYTLAEKEITKKILINATKDLKACQLFSENMKITGSYKKLMNGSVSITPSNIRRIAKLLSRIFFYGLDTAHILTKYQSSVDPDEAIYPYLFGALEKNIFPQLELYKTEFTNTFYQMMSKNDPATFMLILKYFQKNLNSLSNQEDLKSNELLFNSTVNDLVNLFREQSKQ